MGIGTSSSLGEDDHFTTIINPQKVKHLGSHKVGIDPRARVLKSLQFQDVWEKFLQSPVSSFVLTPTEIETILISSSDEKVAKLQLQKDVKEYVELVSELSEKESAKLIDFMAVCSSILFLSSLPIEIKAEQLFRWIVLNPEQIDFNFEDFAIAVKSFERGLSHAIGKNPCSEKYIIDISKQWISLADPTHKGSLDNKRISSDAFFEFVANRQHVVRRLLENLSTLIVMDNKNLEIQEVTYIEKILLNPSGGDEWMANPAWKKTAEKMIPSSFHSYSDTKPSANFSLEWVHGYRGYDCRNNVFYLDDIGDSIQFHAASLSISQHVKHDQFSQIYFNEHFDDIVSIAVHKPNNADIQNIIYIATGEIGKTPSIHVYSKKVGNNEQFVSMLSLKGYHTRGIHSLDFSNDGKYLYSIGLDYTVAIYFFGYDQSNKLFGKMILSAQGPKEKILHMSTYDHTSGNFSEYSLISCGEKHVILWKLDINKNMIKMETIKLNQCKNKNYMNAVSCCSRKCCILTTSEGDMYYFVNDHTTLTTTISYDFSLGPYLGHQKVAINALWSSDCNRSNTEIDLLFTGDRTGKFIVWNCVLNSTTLQLSMTALVECAISGYVAHTPIKDFTLPMNSAAAQSSTKNNGTATVSDSKVKKNTLTVGISENESDSRVGNSNPPAIRSLCLANNGRKLLIGTQKCEIIECSFEGITSIFNMTREKMTIRYRLLLAGHSSGELWGIAVRPATPLNCGEGTIYATVGDDGFLKIWHLETKHLLCSTYLSGIARTCCFSPDGLYLAIGFGGRNGVKTKKSIEDGIVKIIRFDSVAEDNVRMTQVSEIKEAKQWISVVRFSPDGNILAVGSRDNSIYLYSVPHQFRRRGKFSKHNAGINSLDFSCCGKYIQSCCSGYEILFSDSSNGSQIVDGSTKLVSTDWHTWTCTLGWAVTGIWSGNMDGTDVNGVDRSPNGNYLATADDFGKVNLYHFPALSSTGSPHGSFVGHSSHVTCVRWARSAYKNASTDYLLSIGGEDKCVFQWKLEEAYQSGGKAKDNIYLHGSNLSVQENDEEVLEIGGGDEFMAVKPWLGAIVAPTAWVHPDSSSFSLYYSKLSDYTAAFKQLIEFRESAGTPYYVSDRVVQESSTVCIPTPSNLLDCYNRLNHFGETVLSKLYEVGVADSSPPNHDELELDFVYGYRGYDCRNNIFSLCFRNNTDRYILYFAAALGILFNISIHKQVYFRGHSDDIMCMAINRQNELLDSYVVATGQQGRGNVYLWEIPSMQTLHVISTKQKTVNAVAFSRADNGKLLLALSEDKILVAIDWKSQSVLVTQQMEGNIIHGLSAVSDGNSNQFITSGDKIIRLWSIQGRNVTSTKFVTSTCQKAKLQNFSCVVECNGYGFVGTDDGNIYLVPVKGKGVKAVFNHQEYFKASCSSTSNASAKSKSNETSITALHIFQEFLFSGAKDGSIIIWTLADLIVSETIRPAFGFFIQDLFPQNPNYIFARQVQSISVDFVQSNSSTMRMVIGTRGCDIIEAAVDIVKKSAHLHKISNVSTQYNGVIMRGHCNEEVWGLATHPFKPEFCTTGDDKTLRIFHLHSQEVVVVIPIGYFSRCCCYSYDGEFLAVGFGGRAGKGKEAGDGIIRLYSTDYSNIKRIEELKLCEKQDAKQWISDIKFSADSKTIVAGSHDCKIYIYLVVKSNLGAGNQCNLQLRTIFNKHNAVINHLDISLDGQFLQSNCSAYELLFSDLKSGKQITSATEVKDVKWLTWTCTLGWAVQGIWCKGDMDGSDINAVCRSHTGHLLASADDFGSINLFRYPVIDANVKTVKHNVSKGHSSHVMNVRWTCGDEYLISVGGGDKCVFQWKHIMTEVPGFKSSQPSGKKVRIIEDNDDTNVDTSDESTIAQGLNEFNSEPHGGDESGLVKPWLGAVRAPKYPPPISSEPPMIECNLNWVHGYSCSIPTHRQNLFYNMNNNVLYPAASLAICLSRESECNSGLEKKNSVDGTFSETWSQSYFRGHDDDILCMTMSFNRQYIATGQIASKALKGKASVIIWDSAQCRLLSKLEGCHARGVSALAFNYDQSLLISVGMDDNCTHNLWKDAGGNWSRIQLIGTVRGDKATTQFVHFVHPQQSMFRKNEFHFITGNQKILNLWKIEGSNLTRKAARSKTGSASSVTYYGMAHLLQSSSNNSTNQESDYQIIIGSSQGDLLVLHDRELNVGVEKAHSQSIHALASNDDHTILVTGGKDGFVKLWNLTLQLIQAYFVPDLVSGYSLNSRNSLSSSSDQKLNGPCQLFDKSIVAVNMKPILPQTNKSANTILVGTAGGDILEISIPSLMDASQTSLKQHSAKERTNVDEQKSWDYAKATVLPISCGHSKGELWGLAMHPLDSDLFATVGDDAILRVWSTKKHCCLAASKLPRAARTVAWHPTGYLLAVGLVSNGAASGKKKKEKKTNVKAGATTSTNHAPKNQKLNDIDEEEGNETADGGIDMMQGIGNILVFSFFCSSAASLAADLCFRVMGGYPPNINATGDNGSASLLTISELKFSPHGSFLSFGCHDSKLYGYSLPSIVTGDIRNLPWEELKQALLKPTFVFNKHSSTITHFDFSVDECYIQSNDLSCELLFFDIRSKKQETSASKLADYNNDPLHASESDDGKRWYSQSCIFSWAVQGIWPASAYDSSDVNAVDRHPVKNYISTAEDSGIIRILRFPSVIPNSQSIKLCGHSSHVTNVKWGTTQLVSTGGNDKCVFVWEFSEK